MIAWEWNNVSQFSFGKFLMGEMKYGLTKTKLIVLRSQRNFFLLLVWKQTADFYIKSLSQSLCLT